MSRAACEEMCLPARYSAHHDRLLTVDTDPDALLELIELAVTWHELDYSTEPVVGLRHWPTFVERHTWTLPERATRAFSLAVDIVGPYAATVSPTPLSRSELLDHLQG